MAAQTIYKWVDDKGVTHFSENPPPDGRTAAKVQPKVGPPAAAVRPDDWKEREREARRRKLEKEQVEERARARAHNAEAKRRNRCLRAQRELQVLAAQAPVYSVNERGERVYLEDKDRPAEIANWQRERDRYCEGR